MTIYIIDNDPKKLAENLDNKSLDLMIKNIARVLCNVHHINQERIDLGLDKNRSVIIPQIPYKKYKSYEPIAQWTDWARECKANYLYLIKLGMICCDEHAHRFFVPGENHPIVKYERVLELCITNVPDLPESKKDIPPGVIIEGYITSFPLVMPKIYQKHYDKCESHGFNVIYLYRNYYQAKLTKIDNCSCPKCHGMLPYHHNEWTNRQRPEWVNL